MTTEDFVKEELISSYEMDEKTKRHLFNDNVNRVFVRFGENGEKSHLNWNEFEIPKDASIIIEFKDGNAVCFDSLNDGKMIISTNK